jgi:uncharacterized protein (DUF1919 family)
VTPNFKDKIKVFFASYAKSKFYFKCEPFPTIISNDCFGGEIYRALNVKYNTPFIGLMLMAPCYISLLKDLKYYLSQDLEFTTVSKYPSINNLLDKRGYFPIARINGDIEIQFLHYESEKDAVEKWEERKKRMDFDNLLVKFDYSKDYANLDLLKEFLALDFKRKLAVGAKQSDVPRRSSLVAIPEYSTDGAVLFRLSLRYIDYEMLLNKNELHKPHLLSGIFFSKFLLNGVVSKETSSLGRWH